MKDFLGELCQRCHRAMQPDRVKARAERAAHPSPLMQRALAMIERHRQQRTEEHEERDAARWLLAIKVRKSRRAAEARQAKWDREDNNPKLASTRRIWEEIVKPRPRGKTPQQIEREGQRKAIAAANLLIHDPMLWR
jgi:hypothetical protein